jgi:hypothetical protein
MADEVTAPTRIQLRRGDTSEWTLDQNIVLGRAEPAAEFRLDGTLKGLKLGDGVTMFKDLTYFLPWKPIKRNGRNQRLLTTLGGITSGGGAIESVDDPFDLLDQFLHPYQAPDFNFTGTGTDPFEVGTTNLVTLTMNGIITGTNALIKKRIYDVDTATDLVVSVPTPPASTVDTTQLQVTNVAVTKAGNGFRKFAGEIKNSRLPVNDTVTKQKQYEFRYPVFKAFVDSSIDPFALSESQWVDLIYSGVFAKNLLAQGQVLNGTPLGARAVLLYPNIASPAGALTYSALSSIKQGAQPDNILGLGFTQLAKNIVSNKPGQPAWSAIAYRVYVQTDLSGDGSATYYTFT